MAESGTLAGLVQKLGAVEAFLSGPNLREITTKLGVDARKDVDKAVKADLGNDGRMSGWPRIKFGSGFELESESSFTLAVRPAGPWNVLEKGRRGGKPAFPKGRRRKKVYRTPVGPRTATQQSRWRTGATRGKNTFKKASVVIHRETGKRLHRHIQAGLVKAFS